MKKTMHERVNLKVRFRKEKFDPAQMNYLVGGGKGGGQGGTDPWDED